MEQKIEQEQDRRAEEKRKKQLEELEQIYQKLKEEQE